VLFRSVRNQEEFIALARRRPGELNFGSAGIGSATYFGCEYFDTEARLKIVSVPFRGVQEFLTEILGGRIELGCPPVSLALSQIRAGKLTPLSVTSKERVKQLPDVPTTSEAGLPGFEYKIWYGMVASSKTPRAIVDQLAKELSAITQLKDISNAMENEGVTPRDVVTGEFDAFIAKEIAKFRDLANASGITKR